MIDMTAPVKRLHRPRPVKPFYAPYRTNEVINILDRAFETFGAGLWRLIQDIDPLWDAAEFTEWLCFQDKRMQLTMVKMALRKMPHLRPARFNQQETVR